MKPQNRLMLRYTTVLFVFSIIFNINVSASVKEIGVPVIQNFQRSLYHAGTQNWSIDQGYNGVMYFGNNNGMLRYDGQFWNLYTLPNHSTIRKVFYSKEQQLLFVGGFNEFGFFSTDSIGKVNYHSFIQLLPEGKRNVGDVWRIHEGPGGIVFQTFNGLYFYKNGKIDVVDARSEFHFSYYVNGVLYLFDRDNGLMEYRDGFLKKMPGGEFFIHTEIWSVLPLNNDEVLIGTARNGLFVYDGVKFRPWNTPVNELLKKHQIYSSLVVDNNHFAFGTIQNGLIISTKYGEVTQIINREKGLQNNTILSLCLDLDGNLWLGLDNGIDYVEINSPITLLQDFYGIGTGYTSITYNGMVYLGTNQGLFYCSMADFKKPTLTAADFKMVSNTSGQVWSLQVIGNQLICGHNNGSFRIVGAMGIPISDVPGCWAYNALPGYPDVYLEGTYGGVELCRLQNGTIVHQGNVPGVDYSCQEMVCTADRYVWISHAYNGVGLFRLTADLDSLVLIKKYGANEGLPGNIQNKVKQMNNGDLLFTTPNGIYQYISSSDSIVRSGYYNNLFMNKPITYIQEDQLSNIWYVCDNGEGGVLRHLDDGNFSNVSYPFNKLKGKFIGSFFHFNHIDEENVLIALEKGFAHYNPKMIIDYRRGYNAVLNSVSLLNTGEVLYNGVGMGKSNEEVLISPEIAYKNNSMRFTFSALFFEGNNESLFSYQLEGFDEGWSDWQIGSVKEYTNLPEGDYSFKVKTQNKYGVIASPQAFNFTVLPPWYKSINALVIYFVSFIFLIWLLVMFFLKRVEKARIKEIEIQKKKFQEKEEQLKQESIEAEKEIIRLKNEKLKADMLHKDKELANSAINLVQKNKHLNKIMADLKKIQSELREELLVSRIGTMIRNIERETNNDESWSIFETNFENVHEDFLKRIKLLHPDITPKELKLVAYLRMNMSSKEIATLLNITTRGVEIGRYRLRQKFNLDRSKNLTDYILSI
jgi:DNA-binding CsgD family transcriptional regulator